MSGSLPAGECTVEELIPILLSLGEEIVNIAIRQRPADQQISCAAGCGACCRQLVPISLSEAEFLRNQVLPNLKKSHRLRVKQRIANAKVLLQESGLWENLQALPLNTEAEARQSFGLRYFLHRIPCPFLENESCSIHPQRPLACREYLVTSPASHCATPDPSRLVPLPVPQKPSHALIQLDATAGGNPGWQTMIEALSDDHVKTSRIIADPMTFLKNFLYLLLK